MKDVTLHRVEPKMELCVPPSTWHRLSKRMLEEFGLRGTIKEMVSGGLIFRESDDAWEWFCRRVAEEDRADLTFDSFKIVFEEIVTEIDREWARAA